MASRFTRMCLLAAVSSAAVSGVAFAQQAPAGAQDTSTVGEVVVTAQKRSENVQTVPISMTALSGSGLADKGVKSLGDLQFAAPSLSVANAGLTQSVNIRGIGLASGSPNAANGVASYVDGVFQPPIVSSGAYYDIADVEVLRGPQGTFVGSNSTGGAIFINTQSPQLGKFGGYGQVGDGSFNSLSAQGAINIPVGDQIAMRLAVNDQNHDSYYTDHGPLKNHPDKLDELDSRFGLTLKPSEAYQATFKLEQIDRATGGYAYQPVPGTAYATGYSQPSIRDLDYNSKTANNERALQGSLEQHYVLSDGTTIKSITGYENKQIHNLYDVDGTATTTSTQNQFVREKVYTQELDVLSPTSGPLSWVGGGYFQRNRIDVMITDTPTPLNILIQNKKTTLGAFGQVSYKLSDTLTATLGGRYSTYKVEATGGVHIGSFSGPTVGNTGGFEQDHALTGKADLDWKFAPNNLAYAFVARGYKSGGIETPTTSFAKETVWNYEAGWKSTLLDGHVKTQLDAFYNAYDNFQYDTVNVLTGQSAVSNVPSATIAGLEGQVQASLDGFRVDAGLSYVHSELGTYSVIDQNLLPAGSLKPQCATGQTTNCTNYLNATRVISGAPNLLSPEWSINTGVEYAFHLGGGAVLTPRLNYAYQSSQEASPSQESFYQIKARGLVSALVTLDRGDWQLQLKATNLTDEKYVTGYSISGSAGNQFYGAPRVVTISLRRDF